MNNMTFSMTAKQINMMECCAPIEYHTLQGQHPHQQNTERPDASLGGMKNLLITSTLRSCYPVQNMVIDQTQYMLYSLLTPSLPSPDMKNTRITARVEFSIKNRRYEEGERSWRGRDNLSNLGTEDWSDEEMRIESDSRQNQPSGHMSVAEEIAGFDKQFPPKSGD